MDTSNLCVKLFSEMGANVSLQDIDVAYRVPQRKTQRDTPKPIVCKFVRRLAKEAGMARRNEARRVNLTNLGFPFEVSLSSARLFDHLTPKMQRVYSEAKNFKASHGYQYCWAKNSCVHLRKDGDSRAVKIMEIEDLQELLRFPLSSLHEILSKDKCELKQDASLSVYSEYHMAQK